MENILGGQDICKRRERWPEKKQRRKWGGVECGGAADVRPYYEKSVAVYDRKAGQGLRGSNL